jgi:hypothetical protein
MAKSSFAARMSWHDRLRYGRRPQSEAVLFAFDLLELGGGDLRR